MTKYLIRFARWLLMKCGEPYYIASVKKWVFLAMPYLSVARGLIRIENDLKPDMGEYKRHRVYAALQKSFPEAEHKHLALAIELAINDR